MATLDIGEALGEGFRQIGRRPLDTVVWGLAYCLVGLLPVWLVSLWLLGDIGAFLRGAMAGHQAANNPQMMAFVLKMQMLQPLIFLGSIAGRAIIVTAIFRAVLTPEDRGFFYLRLGSRELWVGLVILIQMVCMGLTMFALMLPAMIAWIPAAIAISHNQQPGGEIALAVLAVVAAFGVYIWLFVRFSMAVPMTFVSGQFRLFESWTLTRGHALRLFGLFLVVCLVVMGLFLVIDAIIFAIGFAFVAHTGFNTAAVDAFFRQPPAAVFATLAPYVVGLMLVGLVVVGPYMTLLLAPWARAYAQLEPQQAEVF